MKYKPVLPNLLKELNLNKTKAYHKEDKVMELPGKNVVSQLITRSREVLTTEISPMRMKHVISLSPRSFEITTKDLTHKEYF